MQTPTARSLLNGIWKLKLPTRVQIFIWLMANNKILTVDNLMKRGFQFPSICYMCRNAAEMVQHLFKDWIYTDDQAWTAKQNGNNDIKWNSTTQPRRSDTIDTLYIELCCGENAIEESSKIYTRSTIIWYMKFCRNVMTGEICNVTQ